MGSDIFLAPLSDRKWWVQTLSCQVNTFTQGFNEITEIGSNDNIGIRGFTTWKQKKSSNKMLPQWTWDLSHLNLLLSVWAIEACVTWEI